MNADENQYEALAEFLYLCPIALAEINQVGDIKMMNPRGAQIFMQIARSPKLDNLFEVLDKHLPRLRELVENDPKRKGVICENLEVNAGRPSKRHKQDLVFLISIVRLNPERLIATAQDISWSAAKEKEARASEERLRLLMDGTRNVAIIPVNTDGTIHYWNRSAERLFGCSSGMAAGASIASLITPPLHDDDNVPLAEMIARCLAGTSQEAEGWLRRFARTAFWAEISMSRIDGPDGVEGITVVVRDATRRRREREALLERAQKDNLTGLPNRAHFTDLAQLEFSRWKRNNVPFCVGLLDVDHFKAVNDKHGHLAGDEVLKAISRQCRKELRDVDVIGRYGGEEFALLFSGTDLEGAVAGAERLRATIAAHTTIFNEVAIKVTVSIGVTAAVSKTEPLERLLERADHALYEAKTNGRDQVRAFSPNAQRQAS